MTPVARLSAGQYHILSHATMFRQALAVLSRIIVAGGGLLRGHSLTESAGLLTGVIVFEAAGFSQLVAVGIGIVAIDRLYRLHAFAKAA